MTPNSKLTLALIRFAAFVFAVAGVCLLGVSLHADIFLEMPRSTRAKLALLGVGFSCAAVVVAVKWVDYAIQMPRTRLVGCLAKLFNITFVVFVIGIATTLVYYFMTKSGNSGVAVYSGAILLEQGPYFLNSHGNKSEVSRDVFLERAILFTVIWHLQFMAVSLLAIYTVTFKSLPWPLSTKTIPQAKR